MTLRVYFVVYYDNSTQELVRDEDSVMSRFNGEIVYDSSSDEWVPLSLSLDLESDKAMNAAIEVYNSVIKKIGDPP